MIENSQFNDKCRTIFYATAISALIFFSPGLSAARETGTCQSFAKEAKDKRVGLLHKVIQTAYEESSKPSGAELQTIYFFAQQLQSQLDYLTPLISDRANPLYFWNDGEKDLFEKSKKRLEEKAQKTFAGEKWAQLRTDYKKLMAFLDEYLPCHDASNRDSLTKTEIQALTLNSFRRALANSVIQDVEMKRDDLAPELLEIAAKMESDAPVDWENGHLDQGYKLTGKPKVSELRVLMGFDQQPAAYLMAISARATDPDGEKGSLEQFFILNEKFDVMNTEPEEFK